MKPEHGQKCVFLHVEMNRVMMMIFVKKKSFSVFVLLLFFNMGVSRAPNTASFGIFRYRLWLFKSDWILK